MSTVLGAVVAAVLLASPLAAAPPPLTDADRAAYWLDRILRGPEPARLVLADFHQGVLSDAQANLERLAEPALDRLADAALRARVQANPDINPWHGVLVVLARIGPRRPEVARAWAAPGLVHPDRQVREQALTAIVALGSPVDAPALLDVVRRDAADRVLAPVAISALVALGPPWDGKAARAALEAGRDDGAGVGSTAWATAVAALAVSKAPSRDAVLAWTALVAETGGPRATLSRQRNAALAPDDPDVVPLAATRTTGRLVAAVARARLSRDGAAPYRAAVDRDLAGDDVDLRRLAETGRPRDEAARAAALRTLADVGARLRAAPASVPPDDVTAAVVQVVADRADGAGAALAGVLPAIPVDAAYGEALLRAFDGARALGVEPVAYVAALLARGDRVHLELAMRLVRRAADGPYLEVVEPWLAGVTDPAARSEGRRAAVFLYAVAHAKGRLPAGRADEVAPRVRSWGEDPSDASAAGLLGGLLDLGPAGEREVALGLAGPGRPAYVEVLASDGGRRVGAAVIEALLAPLSARTPAAERQRIFTAVFRAAGPDAVPALTAAVARLAPTDRPEGEALLRLVGHRASRP
ncbi:MAG: hypothetical protein U1E39_14395 [Planctomycetota bacterium]